MHDDDTIGATAFPTPVDRVTGEMANVGHPGDQLTTYIDRWLAATNPHSARSNARALERFTQWAEAPNASQAIWRLIADPNQRLRPATKPDFAEEVLTDYRKYLERATPALTHARSDEIGYSSNSIRAYILGVGRLLRLLRRVGIISWTPHIALPHINAYSRRVTAGIGVDGFQRLVQAAHSLPSPFRERDLAILALTWRGLRVGEIADIDLAHVNLQSKPPCINILGKWRHHREDIELASSQQTALDAWLVIRGATPGPLFWRLDRGSPNDAIEPRRRRRERRNSGGKRLSTSGIWRVFQELGKVAGLSLELCHPHAVRHTVATEILTRCNGNIRLCMSFMRLTKAEVVEIYDDYRQHRGLQGAELLEGIITAQSLPPIPPIESLGKIPSIS